MQAMHCNLRKGKSSGRARGGEGNGRWGVAGGWGVGVHRRGGCTPSLEGPIPAGWLVDAGYEAGSLALHAARRRCVRAPRLDTAQCRSGCCSIASSPCSWPRACSSWLSCTTGQGGRSMPSCDAWHKLGLPGRAQGQP